MYGVCEMGTEGAGTCSNSGTWENALTAAFADYPRGADGDCDCVPEGAEGDEEV